MRSALLGHPGLLLHARAAAVSGIGVPAVQDTERRDYRTPSAAIMGRGYRTATGLGLRRGCLTSPVGRLRSLSLPVRRRTTCPERA
jgi:hypothetical protein